MYILKRSVNESPRFTSSTVLVKRFEVQNNLDRTMATFLLLDLKSGDFIKRILDCDSNISHLAWSFVIFLPQPNSILRYFSLLNCKTIKTFFIFFSPQRLNFQDDTFSRRNRPFTIIKTNCVVHAAVL